MVPPCVDSAEGTSAAHGSILKDTRHPVSRLARFRSLVLRLDACPYATMIGETNRVDVPLNGLKAFQVEPVESEWEAEKPESRTTAGERRVKPVASQQCPARRHLPLQEGQRPHRSEPADVHRVEISSDDLWPMDVVEQWRKLRDSVSTIDARIQVDVHQSDRAVDRNCSSRQRNPASRSETKLVVLQRECPDIVEQIAAQDRETLSLCIRGGPLAHTRSGTRDRGRPRSRPTHRHENDCRLPGAAGRPMLARFPRPLTRLQRAGSQQCSNCQS